MSNSEQNEIEVPQVVNLWNVNADTVRAEFVRANRAAIRRLEAEEADVSGILVGAATAGTFNGRQAVIGALNAKQADTRKSFIGGVRGESISVSGKTAMVVGTSVHSPQMKAAIVAGAQIHAENIRAGVLIGRNVNGNVHTLLDARGALAAGALGGLVAGLVLLAGKLLFRRQKK